MKSGHYLRAVQNWGDKFIWRVSNLARNLSLQNSNTWEDSQVWDNAFAARTPGLPRPCTILKNHCACFPSQSVFWKILLSAGLSKSLTDNFPRHTSAEDTQSLWSMGWFPQGMSRMRIKDKWTLCFANLQPAQPRCRHMQYRFLFSF